MLLPLRLQMYTGLLRLQVYCVFLFLFAASLFGTIIAQVHSCSARLQVSPIVPAPPSVSAMSLPYTLSALSLSVRLLSLLPRSLAHLFLDYLILSLSSFCHALTCFICPCPCPSYLFANPPLTLSGTFKRSSSSVLSQPQAYKHSNWHVSIR